MFSVGSSHAPRPEALEDLIRGPGPYEGLCAAVLGREVLADGLLELDDAAPTVALSSLGAGMLRRP